MMGPIEAEMRQDYPFGWTLEAHHFMRGVLLDRFPECSDVLDLHLRGWGPDFMSEAIEAAEALGL